MRNLKSISILLLAAVFTLTACKKDDDDISPQNNNTTNQTNSLSSSEIEDLQFLREEEKLAHDVYIYAYQQYGKNIFNNIASSELTHTSAVLDILNKYGISDPAANQAEGVFTDSTLQALYRSLTLKADSSLTHALTVGATIEDLDIKDLSEMSVRSTNNDLATLYANLSCGSRNHMRSFYSQLNGNYQAQYISATELQSIVNSGNEKCGQ